MLLAASQDWFRDLQPWVDFNYAQGALFDGAHDRRPQWAHLGVTGTDLAGAPAAVGLWLVLRRR